MAMLDGALAHVVVFSELSPKSKAQYTRFLIQNDVKFARRPHDGRFVANIRIQQAPRTAAADVNEGADASCAIADAVNAAEAANSPRQPDSDDDSGDTPHELRRLANLVNEFGLSLLQRRCNGVYSRMSKLVHLLNEVYDARNEEYVSIYGSPPDDMPATMTTMALEAKSTFASFLRKYLTNRFGLKPLIEQQALEIIHGLQCHRQRVDVEMFICFVEGKYSDRDLGFFLVARAAVQRVTAATRFSANTLKTAPGGRKTRRATTSAVAPVWLNASQLEVLAQALFGAKTNASYLHFAHRMRAFLAAKPAERAVSEAIEAQEVLMLATETFVAMQQDTAVGQTIESSYSASTTNAQASGDDQESLRSSPSPSPLPPPPLPHVTSRWQTPSPSAAITMASVMPSTSQSKAVVHAAEPGDNPDSDIQRRLGSLMERMQQRQSLSSLQ